MPTILRFLFESASRNTINFNIIMINDTVRFLDTGLNGMILNLDIGPFPKASSYYIRTRNYVFNALIVLLKNIF
jgi:hypothetical protein